MAKPKTVGFSTLAKKRKKTIEDDLEIDKRQRFTHSFRGHVAGDVGVAVEAALKKLGWEYWEDVFYIPGPFGGPGMPVPFSRHRINVPGSKEVSVVPWGQYGIKELGEVALGTDRTLGVASLTCSLDIGSTDAKWLELIDAVDAILLEGVSMFKGHALKLQDPHDLIVPNYLDLSKKCEFICNDDTWAALMEGILHPIQMRKELSAAGVNLRRGAILEGKYGVGKSLVAYLVAQQAVANGWTFLTARPGLATVAMQIASPLQPCVVFIEDIDAAAHGNRDHLNQLLNTISSVENKHASEIILLVSTNFIDRIDPGMLRPGRIDSIIELTVPTAPTVERLIKHFSGDLLEIDNDEAWKAVCADLAGTTPAIICEVVTRGKIKAVSTGRKFTTADLTIATKSMAKQRALATPEFRDDDVKTQLADSLYSVTEGNYRNN